MNRVTCIRYVLVRSSIPLHHRFQTQMLTIQAYFVAYVQHFLLATAAINDIRDRPWYCGLSKTQKEQTKNVVLQKPGVGRQTKTVNRCNGYIMHLIVKKYPQYYDGKIIKGKEETHASNHPISAKFMKLQKVSVLFWKPLKYMLYVNDAQNGFKIM